MIRYVTTAAEVVDAYKVLNRLSVLAIDTETEGLDPLVDRLLLLQIGNSSDQYVFDIYQLGKHIAPILKILDKRSVLKILHNAKFDYKFIKKHLGVTMETLRCTMLGEKLLMQGWKGPLFNLNTVLDKYLGKHLDKGVREEFIGKKFGESFTEEEIEYAGDDVKYLIELESIIDFKLSQRGLTDVSRLEYETLNVTGDLELNGVLIDQKKWLALKDDANLRADEARYKLDAHFKPYCEVDLFGAPVINYNSPLQLKPILEKILDKPLSSTGKDYLKMFMSYNVIELLFSYREAAKQISTYGQNFIDNNVHEDGRIYCDFNQLGAQTGRYSSSNPNLQNIPSNQKYRTPFIAEPGYKLISADFQGQLT